MTTILFRTASAAHKGVASEYELLLLPQPEAFKAASAPAPVPRLLTKSLRENFILTPMNPWWLVGVYLTGYCVSCKKCLRTLKGVVFALI